ncbi:serine peptidase DegS [Pseudorhodoferax soli]|jgi:Do/DeqQ family serine protease|uniref:Serine peptidase DegS n=2 Tax=Pseudorhodoferax soli TaxID=545864 RepID=A0A368Y7B4_9BURK|nr:serine peptidase DegS [Pseudorhodoferax soli]
MADNARFPGYFLATMKRFWLLFSQSVTVLLAAYFVVATLKPEWLGKRGFTGSSISVVEAPAVPPGTVAAGSFAPAAKRAAPAVVSINTSTAAQPHPNSNDPWFRFFFGDRGGEARAGLGSGVIVSAEGYVLTNNHVVEGADVIEVILNDARRTQAKVIGTDPETDLAILKIDLDKLPVMVLGSSDALQVGDQVLAIGNPFGVGQTVTSGIISALGRNQLGMSPLQEFIQTDAAINPGNSGGALVDTAGNLLGINTAIYSRSGGSMGIGFAVPVSTAKLVLEGIVRDGQVRRGWIGVEPNDLSPELAETFGVKTTAGVIITGVLQNGPAAQAGVRPGDVIAAVSGKPIGNVTELLSSVAALKPGEASEFEVLRREERLRLQVTPGVRPKPQRAQRP